MELRHVKLENVDLASSQACLELELARMKTEIDTLVDKNIKLVTTLKKNKDT